MSKTPKGLEKLQKSVDELDIELGRLLLADEFGFKPITEAHAKATARHWLAANIVRFRNVVCTHPVIQKQLLHKQAQTRNELFLAVADALVRLQGLDGIPVALLAARLIHYGLEKLCAEMSKEHTS
jgi:hypothetical protein